MIIELSALLAIYFGLFGLLIGSFLNVCVYRIPRRESVVVGRSHCPDCGHTLGPADLVPVLSYLLLGRRCRYCHQPISSRYAKVELLTAFLFLVNSFVLGALSLHRGFPVWLILMIIFLDTLVLAFAWVKLLIANDRRPHPGNQTSLVRPVTILFVADLIHLALFWLILG
ncbi:MAG: Prepilin peptidase [Firmicutes bacterium]|nr:Prepilin peptidase [Bacillota bacterium]